MAAPTQNEQNVAPAGVAAPAAAGAPVTTPSSITTAPPPAPASFDPTKLLSDWENGFAANAGQSTTLFGGNWTENATGTSGTFTAPGGVPQTISNDPTIANLTSIANSNPAIAAAWKDQYGFDPSAVNTPPATAAAGTTPAQTPNVPASSQTLLDRPTGTINPAFVATGSGPEYLGGGATLDAFGSSVTAGFTPSGVSKTNMVEAAQQDLQNKLGTSVTFNNHGVNGQSSSQFLSSPAYQNAFSDGSQVAVFSFGENDMFQGVPVDQFKSNLGSMIQAAKAAGKSVLLQTPDMIPVTTDPSTIGGKTNADLAQYAQAVRDVASQYGIPIDDKWQTMAQLGNKATFSDSLHPDDATYQALGLDLGDSILNQIYKGP